MEAKKAWVFEFVSWPATLRGVWGACNIRGEEHGLARGAAGRLGSGGGEGGANE